MFGIENSRDTLLQLKSDLQKDALNISLAENTCSDAWHLVDWVLIEEKRKETRKHGGAFSSAFSKAFDVSRLEVHLENNSKIDIDDLIKIAIDYWDDLIE